MENLDNLAKTDISALIKVIEVRKQIPDYGNNGIVKCICGNEVKWARSKINGHLHFHCSKCNMGYHE